VHNGIFSDPIKIVYKMIGHKIGEFSITKVLGKEFHLARESKKKKKKKR
jgi:ribosomal protein S19